MPNGHESKNKTSIDPQHWDMILTSIYEGSCVPFLGAAVNISSEPRQYTGLPLGPEVALRLISKMIGVDVAQAKQLAEVTVVSQPFKNQGLDEDLARLWVQHLPRVALHMEVKGNGDRPYLTGRLREILDDHVCTPSQLLRVLARLPLRLIVTTNFDRLLERAIEHSLDDERAVRVEDLIGARSLVTKLRDTTDPVSKHLAAELTPAVRNDIAAYDDAAEPSPKLLADLAAELDRIAHGPSLFDAARFAAIALTAEIRALANTNPQGSALLQLNRSLLEESFPAELRRARNGYRLVVQPVEGFSGNEQQTNPPGDDDLVVYKIHGSFREDGVASGDSGAGVVITEEDYIQFLTVINEPVRGVPNHVLSRLANSTLLFLGYSLDDWDFRMLHKVLIERLSKRQRRSAFAIQWRPPQFWVEYWKEKKVKIYDCDIYDFAEDLERLYVERYGSLGARKSQ